MPAVVVSFPEPDIALLTFDVPGRSVNVLSRAVVDEADATLTELERRADLAGLIIASGKTSGFIAGADIREFSPRDATPDRARALCQRGQSLWSRLSKGKFISVAAIDGVCVGGGAELASWCDRRVLANQPRTEFGFPEVKLGLIPGWGGTVRAPRIVGLTNAIDMICGGESIDVAAAGALGWADDVVAPDQLIAAAVRMVRAEQASQQFVRDRARWNGTLDLPDVERDLLRVAALRTIEQANSGPVAAPRVALELMLSTATVDAAEACRREADAMTTVFGSPENVALVNVFFLNDRAKKDTGLDRPDTAPHSLRAIGVVGAGVMGAGIAAATLKSDQRLFLTDADAEALVRGTKAAIEEASYDKRLKRTTVERATKFSSLLRSSAALESLAACDLIVEAVVETAEVKRQLFDKLELLVRPDAVIASNTSSFPITKLAERSLHPERFCGLHFFNPVRRMRLVEVVRGDKTNDETVATAVAFAKRIGKTPIVVKDGPGFLVNRMLAMYLNEALTLLAEGQSITAIDSAARDFGMPVGPLALYDIIGLDTAFYAGRSLWEAFPDRTLASPVLPALIKAGRLGLKNELGFYSYRNSKHEPQLDPAAQTLLDGYVRTRHASSAADIQDRLVLPMLLEATRILQEGRVRDPRDVDIGVIFGLGFPAFRGGLLFWADRLGAAEILRRLDRLQDRGARFQPTPLLDEMTTKQGRFYRDG